MNNRAFLSVVLLCVAPACGTASTPIPRIVAPLPTAAAVPPTVTTSSLMTLTLTIKDDGCTLEGPTTIPHEVLTINVRMDEQKQTESGYALGMLKEGKTIEDLKAYPSAVQPDGFTLIHGVHEFTNGLHTYTYDYTNVATNPPLFLICFNSNPDTGAWIKRAAFGPFELE